MCHSQFKAGATILFLILNILYLSAQENEERIYVEKTFNTTRLINLTTTEKLNKKSFALNIQHRFGETHLKNDFLKDFMGLDNSSNIRFAFNIPITNKLYFGIGRTKFDKIYDASLNWNLLEQTYNNAIPISVSLFGDVGYSTVDFPETSENQTYQDGTAFYYKNNHRISFSIQLSFARKFGDYFSILMSPGYIYKNLAENNYENAMYIFPLGGKIKTGFSTSIVFEQTFILNKPSEQIHPLALGFEVGTAGHTFQIILSTSNQYLEQEIITNPNQKLRDGYFHLGFNIFRTFFIKK